HALGRSALAVVHERVGELVGVAGDEVAGGADEADEAPVGADRRAGAVAVPLTAGGVDAHALGRAGRAVADEDVLVAVRVAGDEVGRGAREGDEVAVGGERRPVGRGVGVGAGAGGVDADALGRAGLAVMDEDVRVDVGVARDEVVGVARERDEAAIG